MATSVKTATYVDCISTIYTSTISVQAGYCQCQTNSTAPRVILIKYFITITKKLVQFLDKFQIATSESEGITICWTVALTLFIILALNLKHALLTY